MSFVWIVSKRMTLAAKNTLFHRVFRLTLRNREEEVEGGLRRGENDLGVELLLFHIERKQLRWITHLHPFSLIVWKQYDLIVFRLSGLKDGNQENTESTKNHMACLIHSLEQSD